MDINIIILQMENVAVQVGDDVTFHCFHTKDQLNRVMWFKQALGKRPVLLASSYHWTQDSVLYDDFKKSKSFKVDAGIDRFNLTIQRTVQSDSATYYCAVSFSNIVYFGQNFTVLNSLYSFNRIHILQQPHPGITSCGGEQKFYWFRRGSGKSHPGIIYAQRSCKNSSVTVSTTKSCVYSLSMRNIKVSDAGTYCCAVVTCREILFGHGINLASDGKCHFNISDTFNNFNIQDTHLLFVIVLTVLLTSNITINILLCCMRRNGKCLFEIISCFYCCLTHLKADHCHIYYRVY
uniref:Ig-like domain-containing protein n=1 Tax=Sinocyclocheilus anshuiensis TaxID=1608454 RepID=A0A671LXC4_9TELE